MNSLSDTYPLLTDGAWGTELQALGLQPGVCPDLLNLTHPDWVLAVARSYVQAGSDIILTNTFGSNGIALHRYGAADRGRDINFAGVELSRQAADGRARVYASIGPTGKILLMGDVSEQELFDIFGIQASFLAEAGVDAIVIETMTDLGEALIALEAVKATGLPVVLSMVFDSGPDQDRTMMGLSPQEVALKLTDAGADVVGANCGIGVESAVTICEQLRKGTHLPIWLKPNAGLPVIHEGNLAYTVTPEEFSARVPDLIAAGASYIGGCCGTTPAHINAMRRTMIKNV